MYNNELYHHGIKGMKWGRRRYQNEDGSLTDAGIKRYARKGYAQDSYNSNKTIVGKAYDKYTGAHVMVGDAVYATSSKSANKARAEKYLADKAAKKRGYPDKLESSKSDSSVTKRVKNDYNNMTDQEFTKKYSASKKTYAKRVEKYGDPYMNAPLAKLGKKLANKKKTTKNDNVSNIIERERKRQRRHLAGKHAVRTGAKVVNGILSRNNVTLNGKALRINPGAVALVNLAMNYKYMKDTFK